MNWVGVFLIAVVSFIVGTYVLSRRSEKRHDEELVRTARQLGFSYNPTGQTSLPPGVFQLPLFAVLRKPFLRWLNTTRIKNVLTSNGGGLETIVLDHVMPNGEGDDYITTMACFHLKVPLPEFQLWPVSAPTLKKLFEVFGASSIKFTTHPEFSQRYRLKGADESAVRAVFQPQILDCLTQKKIEGFSVESAGDWLAVYCWACQVLPEQLSKFLHEAREIAELFLSRSSMKSPSSSRLNA